MRACRVPPESSPGPCVSLGDTGELLTAPPPPPRAVPIWRCCDRPHRCLAQGPAHLWRSANARHHHYTCSQGHSPAHPLWQPSGGLRKPTSVIHRRTEGRTHSLSLGLTGHHLEASKSGSSSKSARGKQPDGQTEAPGARPPLPAPPRAAVPNWVS